MAVTAAPTAAPPAAAVRRRSPRPPALLLLAAAAVALLTLVPLGFVAYETVQTGWTEASRLVFRQRTADLLGNTVRLTVGCVALSLLIGVGAAWLVERSDLPGRRMWTVLLVAPLAVPSFVNAFGWVSLAPGMDGYTGAVTITTLSYFPQIGRASCRERV